MEKIYLVFNEHPLSYNTRNSEKKNVYKKNLGEIFKKYSKNYYEVPSSSSFESRIVYYNRTQNKPDIDNLSKPIIDSFKGIIYNDDSQVIQRVATRYDLRPMEVLTIDCTQMPYDVAQDVDSYMRSRCEHLVLCSFAEITREDLMEA